MFTVFKKVCNDCSTIALVVWRSKKIVKCSLGCEIYNACIKDGGKEI